MEEQTIDLKNTEYLIDLLDEFKVNYVDKMLLRRDQLWEKHNGAFNEKQMSEYEETRIKSEFILHLYDSMKILVSNIGVTADAMEDFLATVEKMKLAPEGEWRESLFSEQRKELSRVTLKIKKRYAYFTESYENISK